MSMYVKILKANKLKNTCRERGIKRLFVVITYNKFIHLTFIGLAARDTEIKGFEAQVPPCRGGQNPSTLFLNCLFIHSLAVGVGQGASMYMFTRTDKKALGYHQVNGQVQELEIYKRGNIFGQKIYVRVPRLVNNG